MFPQFRLSAALAMAAGLLAAAPLSAAQAATPDAEELCVVSNDGRCAFTAGREGVHLIQLAVPAPRAAALHELSISGQQCPLTRRPGGDAVNLSCFAYLSGGMTYQLSVPPDTSVRIVKTDPANGEPVTLIP